MSNRERADFEIWLYSGHNQQRAMNYVRNHAHLVPERIAIDPAPRYNRRSGKLTVWMFVFNDKGEKVLTDDGAQKVKTTVKKAPVPPWVQ